MKKLITILLTACLILGLTACGSTPASTAEPSGTSGSAADTTAASTESDGPDETYPYIAEQTDLDKIAVSSEHFSFTKGEMAYFFALTFKNYYSYLSYFGVDPAVSLKEQKYEDRTWFDVFMEEAMHFAENYLLFSEAALARGIEMNEEDKAYIESQRTGIAKDAATHGWDSDTYLGQLFGTNISWEILDKAMQKMMLADRGYEAVIAELEKGISEEDILKQYEENRKQYQYVDYVDINFLDGEAISDELKAELAKAFVEAKDEAAFAAAVALFAEKTVDAETIGKAGSVEKYAEQLMTANTKTFQQYAEGELLDWAFGDERSGDVFVQAEEKDGARHAYLLKAAPYRDDETYVNVRHILFMTQTLGSAEAARAKAEEIYQSWKDGEKTEDSFAALATELSEDGGSASNGGLYEDVYRGQMVPPFEEWCFDASRAAGDTGIVDTDYGSHIMYFVSSDTGWHHAAREDLLDKAYGEVFEELQKSYPLTVDEEVLNAINW